MKKKILSIIVLGIALIPNTAFAFSDIAGHWAKGYIETFEQTELVRGYPDGTFRPDNNITREEAFQIMSTYAGEYDDTGVQLPKDTKNRWSTNAIRNLLNGKLISGYEDGSIRPQKNITRAEYAKLICTYLSKQNRITDSQNTFLDIDNHWAVQYIELLAGNNVISGYTDGTFMPDKYITRAEAVTIFSNLEIVADVGVNSNDRKTIAEAKKYLQNGPTHLSKDELLKWDNGFVDTFIERELIFLYKNYLNNGGDRYNSITFAKYFIFNSQVS